MRLPGFIVSAILITIIGTSSALARLPPVDVELSVTADSISSGDSVTFNMAVENYLTTEVVTTAVVTLSLPPGATDAASSDCTLAEPLTMVCVLPELAPDEIINISATASLNLEGNNQITASVTLTELEYGEYQYDSRTDSQLVAVEVLPADQSPIDLQVEFALNSNETKFGTNDHIGITIRNNHDTNTALFPFIELTLEDSYEFRSGDHCTAQQQLITCNYKRLPPGTEASATIILVARKLDDAASVTASVSSTQADLAPQNNDSQYDGIIVPASILCGGGCPADIIAEYSQNPNFDTGQTEPESVTIDPATAELEPVTTEPGPATEEPEPAAAEPAPTTTDTSNNSGGGVVPIQVLLLLLFSYLVSARMKQKRGFSSPICSNEKPTPDILA